QIHQRRVEDDALRVANLGNGLRHDVILCITTFSSSASAHHWSLCVRLCTSAQTSANTNAPLLNDDQGRVEEWTTRQFCSFLDNPNFTAREQRHQGRAINREGQVLSHGRLREIN